ncbi:hypothetical protein VP01_1072g2 [Puccinia sorghi]|uniref:Uncharacterized protein n=1 Tax=Puccinia sorghi TaxID=27349 RepID=A0A0L6VTW8_9BASI|nr:hypothetical protein VP01_1072g2 [Puccinia sorghi]
MQSQSEMGEDKSDDLGLKIEVTASHTIILLASSLTENPTGNANLDSGCSLRPHAGASPSSPYQQKKAIRTLIVPCLHEILLYIDRICDLFLTAVSTYGSCNTYSSSDDISATNFLKKQHETHPNSFPGMIPSLTHPFPFVNLKKESKPTSSQHSFNKSIYQLSLPGLSTTPFIGRL